MTNLLEEVVLTVPRFLAKNIQSAWWTFFSFHRLEKWLLSVAETTQAALRQLCIIPHNCNLGIPNVKLPQKKQLWPRNATCRPILGIMQLYSTQWWLVRLPHTLPWVKWLEKQHYRFLILAFLTLLVQASLPEESLSCVLEQEPC